MQKFKNPVSCYFREQSAAVTAIYFCCISKYVRINTVFLKYECHLQSLSLKRIQCTPVGANYRGQTAEKLNFPQRKTNRACGRREDLRWILSEGASARKLILDRLVQTHWFLFMSQEKGRFKELSSWSTNTNKVGSISARDAPRSGSPCRWGLSSICHLGF